MQHPKLILAVDGDVRFLDLIGDALPPPSYELSVATGGREGLHKAQTLQPRLVLLDLALPELNGVELCRLLRADPRTRGILLVAMTALETTGSVVRSALLALGVDDFLQKPFGKEHLLERVKLLLARRRHQASRAPRKTAPPSLSILENGRIRVDLNTRRVWVKGRLTRHMGPKRFQLLCMLLRHKDGAHRETLCSEVWGEEEGCKKVDVSIHRLREDFGIRKEDSPIISVPGGYKLVG